MHRLTGAELTKLIDLKLVVRECWALLVTLHQTTAHTKTLSQSCQEKTYKKNTG